MVSDGAPPPLSLCARAACCMHIIMDSAAISAHENRRITAKLHHHGEFVIERVLFRIFVVITKFTGTRETVYVQIMK